MKPACSLKDRSVLYLIATLILGAITISGCGQQVAGVGTGGTGGGNQYAMGGAIQGKELSLTNTVTTIAGNTSTVAGTPDSADGTGTEARFDQPTGITSDGTNLFVVDSAKHTIRKVVIATGVVTTLAGSPGIPGSTDGIGPAARFNSPAGITTDGVNLYVVDSMNNTIRKIIITTGEVTTIARARSQELHAYGGLAGIATDGTNLYVVNRVNHIIVKIVIFTGEISTLAGSAGNSGSADGIGTAARFSYPRDITTDGTNLYVTDRESVRKLVIATGAVSTIAQVPSSTTPEYFTGIISDGDTLYVTGGFSIFKISILSGTVTTLRPTEIAGENLTATPFLNPGGITIDGHKNLYVADRGYKRIRKVDLSTNTVTTLAGSPPSVDGTGASASFSGPIGITTDGASLYVADTDGGLIRKIDIATGRVSTLAGNPSSREFEGIGTDVNFNRPTGITTDGNSLFVTDHYGIRIIEISTGAVIWLGFSNLYDITTDGKYLYVIDHYNNKISKIEISTRAVTTLAIIEGAPWSADPDGLGGVYVQRPTTTDGTSLFVMDGDAIRKIEISTGVVTTLVGEGVFAGQISGISTDGTNLYVTDMSNTVSKVVISTGEVTTLVGTPGAFGASDGTGAAASFNEPMGITTDGKSLYVADYGNRVIRRIR